MTRFFSALVAVLAAVAFTGCTSEENDPALVEPGTPAAEPGAESTAPSTEAPAAFAVGDQVALGDWTLIVHELTDPFDSGDEVFVPAEGMRYVLVDAEVAYNGTEPQTVSTLLCFELQDSANWAHPEVLVSNPVGTLDGEIASGGARRGGLVYEVPGDATGLRLNFKCDPLSSGTAMVALS